MLGFVLPSPNATKAEAGALLGGGGQLFVTAIILGHVIPGTSLRGREGPSGGNYPHVRQNDIKT